MGIFDRIREGLRKTRDAIFGRIDQMLKSFTKIDEELFEELEELLVMGDVGIETSEKICDELRKRVKQRGITDPSMIYGLLAEVITEMLQGGQALQMNTKPSVILVIGVNGVGKTTTIGKMAARFVKEGKRVTLAAADTFRAAAIDQLQIWADRAGADIIKQNEGSDPAAVVFDAISSAKARGSDVIIADTAGRLHNKRHLMAELEKINRIINRELPDADKEVLLVLDATTGQNAVNQTKEFKTAAGITGIVLTKLDGTTIYSRLYRKISPERYSVRMNWRKKCRPSNRCPKNRKKRIRLPNRRKKSLRKWKLSGRRSMPKRLLMRRLRQNRQPLPNLPQRKWLSARKRNGRKKKNVPKNGRAEPKVNITGAQHPQPLLLIIMMTMTGSKSGKMAMNKRLMLCAI